MNTTVSRLFSLMELGDKFLIIGNDFASVADKLEIKGGDKNIIDSYNKIAVVLFQESTKMYMAADAIMDVVDAEKDFKESLKKVNDKY